MALDFLVFLMEVKYMIKSSQFVIIPITFFISIILVQFQNCAPSSHSKDLEDHQLQEDDNRHRKLIHQSQYDLNDVSILEFPAQKKSQFSNWENQSLLSLNVETGIMTETSSSENDTNHKYCLAPDEFNQLQEIIMSASVCSIEMNIDQDTICAQRAIPPYARIHLKGGIEFSLGESIDSCHYGLDLCDQQNENLKEFLTSLQSNLAQHQCEI